MREMKTEENKTNIQRDKDDEQFDKNMCVCLFFQLCMFSLHTH